MEIGVHGPRSSPEEWRRDHGESTKERRSTQEWTQWIPSIPTPHTSCWVRAKRAIDFHLIKGLHGVEFLSIFRCLIRKIAHARYAHIQSDQPKRRQSAVMLLSWLSTFLLITLYNVAYHHQGWEVILAWNLHRCHWKCYWQYYCCPLRSRSVQHWLETLPHQQSRPQWSPLINGPLKLVCLKGHCFQSPKNCLYSQFPEKERKIDHYTFQFVSLERKSLISDGIFQFLELCNLKV